MAFQNSIDMNMDIDQIIEELEREENILFKPKEVVNSCSCHYSDELSKILLKIWMVDNTKILDAKEIVFVCIGTDRSTGDCLGPLVGTKLKDYMVKNAYVYGTLEEPVHAKNLDYYREILADKHPDAFIVAIDACLGKFESVGKVMVKEESLKPGAAMDKELGEIGHIGIIGIVNIVGVFEFMVLQNTRLFTTMSLADTIVDNIVSLLNEYEKLQQYDGSVAIGEN
jgi:putative sporulation protein YyaC